MYMFWCDKRCYFASSCRKGIKKREETTAIKTITLARWYHCSFDFNSRRKSLWMAARCDWNKIKTIAAIHLTGLAGRSLPAFFFFILSFYSYQSCAVVSSPTKLLLLLFLVFLCRRSNPFHCFFFSSFTDLLSVFFYVFKQYLRF